MTVDQISAGVTALCGAATRSAAGWREEAGWVQRGRRRSFVFLHLPSDPVGAIVICSPVGGEADANYRREVVLARSLAARGVAVLRQHYLGTANSDGSPADLTFDSMVDDVLFGSELLCGRSGRSPALLGTRLAAYVAAAAATRTGAPGLALWHPPADGRGYFRELGRMRRMNKLAQQAGRSLDDTRTIEQELATDGRTELAGYEIHEPFHRSMSGLSLGQFEPSRETATLVVQFGGPELGARLAEQIDAWRLAGASCGVTVIPEREVWWFANDLVATEHSIVTRQAVETTTDWMESICASISTPGRQEAR